MFANEESKRCRYSEGEIKNVKKGCRSERFGKEESAFMQTVGVVRHTLTNTHAVGFPVGPLCTVLCSACIGMSRWTGQLLEQRLLVAL